MWAVVVLGLLTAVFAWVWFGGRGQRKGAESPDTVHEDESQQPEQDAQHPSQHGEEVSHGSDSRGQPAEGAARALRTEVGEKPCWSQVVFPADSESRTRVSEGDRSPEIVDTSVEERLSGVTDHRSAGEPELTAAEGRPQLGEEPHHLSPEVYISQDSLESSDVGKQSQPTEVPHHPIVSEEEGVQDSKDDLEELVCTTEELVASHEAYFCTVPNAGVTVSVDLPASADVEQSLAATETKLGNEEEAVDDVKASITTDQPITSTETKLGNDDEAVDDVKASITTDQPITSTVNQLGNDDEAVDDVKASITTDPPITSTETKLGNEEAVDDVKVSVISDQPITSTETKLGNDEAVDDVQAPVATDQPTTSTDNQLGNEEAVDVTSTETKVRDDVKASVTTDQPITNTDNQLRNDEEDVKASVTSHQPITSTDNQLGNDEEDVKASVTSDQPITGTESKLGNDEEAVDDVKASVITDQPIPSQENKLGVDDVKASVTSDQPITSTENQLENDEMCSPASVVPCTEVKDQVPYDTIAERLVQAAVEHVSPSKTVQEVVESRQSLSNQSTATEDGKAVCSSHSEESKSIKVEVTHADDGQDAVKMMDGPEETLRCSRQKTAVFLEEYSARCSTLIITEAVRAGKLDRGPLEKPHESRSPEVASSKNNFGEYSYVTLESCEQSQTILDVGSDLLTDQQAASSSQVNISKHLAETDNVSSTAFHKELLNIQTPEDVLTESRASVGEKHKPLPITSTKEELDLNESSLGEKGEATLQDDAQRTKRVAAVQPMPQNVNLGFKVHYITHSDVQVIAVTGDHEKLGGWEVYVPLTPDKDGFWSHTITLPADTNLEWKFVMVENGKIKRWEECHNRCLRTAHEDIVAQQSWGYP